jgi:hypothetical protein
MSLIQPRKAARRAGARWHRPRDLAPPLPPVELELVAHSFTSGALASATMNVQSNGGLSGGLVIAPVVGPTEWLASKPDADGAARCEARVDNQSAALTGPTLGAWHALSEARAWSLPGGAEGTVTARLTIREIDNPTNAVDAVMTWSVEA